MKLKLIRKVLFFESKLYNKVINKRVFHEKKMLKIS